MWLFLLDILFVRLIHVVHSHCGTLFHCMCLSQFIDAFSCQRALGGFRLGAVMKGVPRNILEHVLCSAKAHVPVMCIFRRRNVHVHYFNCKVYLSFISILIEMKSLGDA